MSGINPFHGTGLILETGESFGLYRNAHPVMTPHINQLAAEGVAFARAYADCPICMPQRVTMLTGKTGSQLRCLTNFSCANRPVFDHRQTLPAHLAREAGYQTKAIGKMHFAPARARYGFEHVTLHPDDYLWWLEDHGYGGTFRGHGLGVIWWTLQGWCVVMLASIPQGFGLRTRSPAKVP